MFLHDRLGTKLLEVRSLREVYELLRLPGHPVLSKAKPAQHEQAVLF
jgi:hypothetical protein